MKIGCPCVDTADGLHAPEELSDQDAMAELRMKEEKLRTPKARSRERAPAPVRSACRQGQ